MFNIKLWTDWTNRTGAYARFAGFGQPSQDFTIQWGYHHWDTNNACRECAAGKHGWGEGSKFGNGAWCDGRSGSLPGAAGYSDSGNWGNQGFGNMRKWWTCKRTDAQIKKENEEYQNARPVPRKISIPEPPRQLPPYFDILLSSNALDIFMAAHFVIDYLLDLYLEELYTNMSPQEIRIGLPVEKFIEFYKMLDSDHSIVKKQIAGLNEIIKAKTDEIDNLKKTMTGKDMRKLESAEKSLTLQLETNKSKVNALTLGLVVSVFLIIILCIILWNRSSSA